MDEIKARQRSRTYSDLARAFSEAEPGLEHEFARLFIGPARPVAHPHESVYREGRIMGETTLDVRRRLAAEGLAANKHSMPDHAGIELAFMAHLAAQEALAWDAGEYDVAKDLLQKQEAFLTQHLDTWFPQFCHRILAGRPLSHYAQLAQRAKSFVANDTAQIRLWLGGTGTWAGSVGRSQAQWTVTVTRKCTLCHTCVEVCQPGALTGSRDGQEGTIRLDLDPSRCDGCAACERWCPEGAIRVAPAEDRMEPGRRELAHCTLLACPACGRPHVPEAMIAGIVERLGSAQESLAQRLLLCCDCRATDVPLQRRDVAQHLAPGLSHHESRSEGRSR